MLFPMAILSMDQESDRHFLERLYLTYRTLMFRKALSILRDPYDVEDAINDVFLRLADVVPLLRSMDCCTLRAYLVSTIRNASYNLAQRRLIKERHSVYDSEGLILSAQPARDNIEDEILRGEQIETLKQALSRLPDREFTVLSMRYFEEAGDLEIARALDISPKSVRTYLTRARRRLNEIMKEMTGDGKQSNE